MKKAFLIILFFTISIINANVGFQYEYKRSSSVGILINTDSRYSVVLKGLFEIHRDHLLLGGEISNSIRHFQKGKISSAISLDLGCSYFRDEIYYYSLTDDSTKVPVLDDEPVVLEGIKTISDLFWGIEFTPIEYFSIITRLGIGTTWTEQTSFQFELLPSIGLKLLIPKKGVQQGKAD